MTRRCSICRYALADCTCEPAVEETRLAHLDADAAGLLANTMKYRAELQAEKPIEHDLGDGRMLTCRFHPPKRRKDTIVELWWEWSIKGRPLAIGDVLRVLQGEELEPEESLDDIFASIKKNNAPFDPHDATEIERRRYTRGATS